MKKILLLKHQKQEDSESPEFSYLLSYCLLQAKRLFELKTIIWNEQNSDFIIPDSDYVLVLGKENVSFTSETLKRMCNTLNVSIGENWAKWVRGKWRKEARIYWQTDVPIESYLLTGALLAIRRDAWEKVGSFDGVYQLYYEEADWLKRLEKSKLKSCYVPAACAVHTYNQSAAKEPEAKKWFQESTEMFSLPNTST